MSTVLEFQRDLQRWGVEVEEDALTVFRAAAEDAAEALVVGNQYGFGVPTDTGFARSSFRVGLGRPADGPSERPAGLESTGSLQFGTPVLAPTIQRATLDRALYVTSNVGYLVPLELLPKVRRYGPHAGQSTIFLRPIESRWENIVFDNMRRLGIGDVNGSQS